MELLLEPDPAGQRSAPFWKDPSGWLRSQNLSSGYWTLFSAAFFYDAGFAVYFFLFNLYLLDCGFNERVMGLIGGAMTLGTLVGTLPAGALAKKFGIRPLLLILFFTAPSANAVRALWMWEPAQIVLAFFAGLFMSSWGICFLTAVARLTREENRTSGFSLIFSVAIGTSMLGGIVCGYLRQWLGMAAIVLQPIEVKRLILLVSCGIVLLGLVPTLRMRVPVSAEEANRDDEPERRKWLRAWKIHPFLARFLPLIALWSAVVAAFTPFANIFLTKDLHIPMTKIGLIFSAVQIVQLSMGLVAPLVFRALGLVNGVVAMQVAAAATLAMLACAANEKLAIVLYLTFAAAQWMSSPGLYNLLMNETPDNDRTTAAAMTMFGTSLAGSLATAGAGILFTRFGYPPVLLGLAAAALLVALLCRLLAQPSQFASQVRPAA